MTEQKKVLFNGPVLRVEQDEFGTHLMDQWGKAKISAHVPTSELRDALTIFISTVEGRKMRITREEEENEEDL